MTSEKKHVQTELSGDEYDRLVDHAREQDLSIKQACQRAILEWIHRKEEPDPRDPAFTVLDELDDSGPRTDITTEGDLVEEWHGSDVEFELAEIPEDE